MLEILKELTSQLPTGNLHYKFQNTSSYFNSTPVSFLESYVDVWNVIHIAGSQPGSGAVLGVAWTWASEACAHRQRMALTGLFANDNLLVQCWWECGLARPTTFQTFPRERGSCNQAVTQTSARLTHFLHTQHQLHIVGGKGRRRQLEENREA